MNFSPFFSPFPKLSNFLKCILALALRQILQYEPNLLPYGQPSQFHVLGNLQNLLKSGILSIAIRRHCKKY